MSKEEHINLPQFLVPTEYISCIDLLLYIIQTSIIAIGDDGMALGLEGFEVVLYFTTEEGAALFQGWLIDDYLCTLCLDTLHDALDGRLAEVIAVTFILKFSKTYPSFLTVKEGSTSHLGLLSSGEKKETALLGARNRYALRLADHQRSSPCYAGWDRLGAMTLF